MTEQPTLLLVHGGWSGAWVWDYLKPELDVLGASSLAIELPGCSATRTFAWRISLTDYVNTIVASAKRIDGPVVLVAHSAGGFAASQAAAIQPHCFSSLIYLAAYLPVDGESLASLSAKDESGNVKSAIKPNLFRGTLIQTNEAIKAASYHDCPAELTDELVSKHRPEPIRPSMSKVRLGEEFDRISKHYIQCTEDRALAPAFQKWMADRNTIVAFHQLNAGHMPMITSPAKLASMLVEIASSAAQ